MSSIRIAAIASVLVAALLVTPAMAQDFIVSPLGYTTYRPVVTYSPVLTPSGTITTYSPVVTPYGARVIRSYRPVVTYPRTVYPRTVYPRTVYPRTVRYRVPVVTYRPAVVRYRVPTTVYQPMVTTYSPVLVPASPWLVRPKIYVTGQPIRNVLRAITP